MGPWNITMLQSDYSLDLLGLIVDIQCYQGGHYGGNQKDQLRLLCGGLDSLFQ